MFEGRRVAVVVPAFNEGDKIARTIRSIPGFVDHVIVVDDASRDDTVRQALRSRRRGLELLRHDVNRGVGAAIETGYRRALDLDAAITAVMAGDSQMDPLDLRGLVGAVAAGRADYAKGNRFLWPAGLRGMPLSRRWGNAILSHATRIATGLGEIFDSQCGYTAAGRRALRAILSCPMFPRYGYPNHVLARLAEDDLVVADVAVRPVYGPDWRSGIRPVRVAGPIAWLLARIALRRAVRGLRRWTRREAAVIADPIPTRDGQ